MSAKISGMLLLLAVSCVAEEYPVPMPDPVQTDVRVGAYIFPGWENGRGEEYGEWKLIAKFAKPRPLLGFYDQAMPQVWDWQLNWALHAGVSWVAFDWYYYSGEKRLNRTLDDGFLGSRYGPMMDFCIHWCNHPVGSWPPLDYSPEGMQAMIRLCVSEYFSRPNYLRIHDRPVFMIWDIGALLDAVGGQEAFRETILPGWNRICNQAGLKDLFLVLVNNDPFKVADYEIGDAFTGYADAGVMTQSVWSRPGSAPYSEMVDAMGERWEQLHRKAKPFITSAHSGWDDMPRTLGWGNDTRWARPGNTPQEFARLLGIARPMIEPELPFLIIEAWNEWGEGSFIEPGKQYGFGQLEAIRRVFAPDAGPAHWPRPTPEQVQAYSILQGEALEAARQREDQPDPTPTVIEQKLNVTVDPADEGVHTLAEFHFPQDVGKPGVYLNTQLEPLGVRRGRAAYRITGNDPQVLFVGDWGPLTPGMAIEMRLRYTADQWPQSQVFWAVDGEDLTGEVSRYVVYKRDGKVHTYRATFRPDLEWTGRLTQFRVDPPGVEGAQVEIEYIRLLTPTE